VSMLGITLSSYVKQLQLFGEGWVGPKYFAFEVDSNSSQKSLAPGETVTYDISVSNHDNQGVAQIPLHVSIEIEYPTQLAGTGAILAELYYNGTVLASDTGTGLLTAVGATMPANTSTTDIYSLKLTWQNADMVLLGDIQSTIFDPSSIDIRVSGYQ
jgi:hypothetical protein